MQLWYHIGNIAQLVTSLDKTLYANVQNKSNLTNPGSWLKVYREITKRIVRGGLTMIRQSFWKSEL